jgi:hypothetical protein
MSPRTGALALAVVGAAAISVTPGQVLPTWPQTYQLNRSTAIMICNNSGLVNAEWAKEWTLVDVDWNSDKVTWSSKTPMDAEEDMLANLLAIKQASCTNGFDPTVTGSGFGPGCSITWLYRNGIKALPWHTTVRTRLEDPAFWGWFMPKAGCSPSPGVYVCKDADGNVSATANLYHDSEQTPKGDCGVGVQCGEYVFNHRNDTILSDFFLLNAEDGYFFGTATGLGNETVDGFYIDDGWSASGPSEMDKNATECMGMTPADIAAMTEAWAANVATWRAAFVAASKFEWFLFYGGQQTAPGWSQTEPWTTCQSYLQANCGAASPSQNGTLFLGFSRVQHSQAWYPNGTLPSPEQDIAAFLLTRGAYAYVGYGWTGCADAQHPFTRPALLDADFGSPVGFCSETAPGSQVWTREFDNAVVRLDCGAWKANYTWKQ